LFRSDHDRCSGGPFDGDFGARRKLQHGGVHGPGYRSIVGRPAGSRACFHTLQSAALINLREIEQFFRRSHPDRTQPVERFDRSQRFHSRVEQFVRREYTIGAIERGFRSIEQRVGPIEQFVRI